MWRLSSLSSTIRSDLLWVGMNGFGSLGRAVFCSTLTWPHVDVVAVNDPFIDAQKAADLLKHDQYSNYLDTINIQAASSSTLVLQTADVIREVKFSSEHDPSDIPWKSQGVLHVIECSGNFESSIQATRHLHTAMTFDREVEFEREHGVSIWDKGGAMKVLIATTSSDVPKFWPGVNKRNCMFRDYVLACGPPDGEVTQGVSLWNYAGQILRLLNVVLARDGSVANQTAWTEEGRGNDSLSNPKGRIRVAMEHVLNLNLPGSDLPDEMQEYFIEAANSAYIDVVDVCGCCQNRSN